MSKHGRVEAMFTVPTGGWTCTIQGGSDGAGLTATLAAGDYYTDSMIDATATAFNATATLDTWTVVWGSSEDGNGKGFIGATGGNCSVTWVDTEWRDLMGYESDGNLSGAILYNSTDQCKMCWFPDGPHVTLLGPNDDGWSESDLRSTESPGGAGKTLGGANDKTVNQITWTGISRAKCRIAGESTGNESFQQFHLDGVRGQGPGGVPGAPWNFYWDADLTAKLNCYAPNLGIMRDLISQLSNNVIEQWNITIPRVTKVPT